jgi:hypothetical protein
MTTRLKQLGLVLGCALALPAAAQEGGAPFCQILDRFDDPIWEVSLGYVASADLDTDEGRDSGVVEFDAGTGLAYFYTGLGTVDLRAALTLDSFTSGGGVRLPGQVGTLNLELHWIHRTESGLALRLGMAPGFYTDFEDLSGRDFFVPLSAEVVQAFNPQWSGLAGLAVFPGFDHVVDPRLGVRWGPTDSLLVDLFYPESKIVFAPSERARVWLAFHVLLYPEYQLEEDDSRERFLYDESRWTLGASHVVNDAFHAIVQVGRVLNREIDFEDGGPRADMDNAWFVQFGIGGFL